MNQLTEPETWMTLFNPQRSITVNQLTEPEGFVRYSTRFLCNTLGVDEDQVMALGEQFPFRDAAGMILTLMEMYAFHERGLRPRHINILDPDGLGHGAVDVLAEIAQDEDECRTTTWWAANGEAILKLPGFMEEYETWAEDSPDMPSQIANYVTYRMLAAVLLPILRPDTD